MRLNVDLINESGMDCVEMEYASIAKSLGRNYELMYTDAWGFELADQIKDISVSRFSEDELKTLKEQYKNTVGNRLSAGDIKCETYLKQYHGIDVQKVIIHDKESVIQEIKAQIDQKLPVAMWFDQHYMAWTKEIRKNGPLRYAGRLLIHGYDDEQRSFQCIDIHGRTENQSMPYDTFKQFLNETKRQLTYDTFQVVGKDMLPSLDEFFGHTIKKVLGQTKEHPNMFMEMKKFADYVRTSLDMEKEIAISQGPRTMPNTPTHIMFIRNFVRIARMRSMYALAVEYLGKIHNDRRLFEISNQFRIFSANWHQIVAILTKAFFREDYSNLNTKLYEHILLFAEEEERMLSDIMNFKENGSSEKEEEEIINVTDSSVQMTLEDKDCEHESCDIRPYFNNRAFALEKSNDCHADFDGIGNYFLLEPGMSKEEVNVKEVPFHVCFHTEEADNVTCQGQTISLKKKKYDAISLLAACDSGPFFGQLKVTYEDGTKEKIVYGFGEWRFKMCEFREKTALECDRVYQGKIHPEERGYLFYKVLPLKPEKAVQSIQLPQCTNMHIFSITCSKIKER